jgi:hypothetical protein
VTNSADPLETRLERMFRIPMPAGASAHIDSRIAPTIAEHAARQVRRPLRRGSAIALAAVLLVTAGAAAAGTLFERIADSGPSDYQLAWERGTDIGVSVATADGPFMVVRGYADSLRVVLAVELTTDDQLAGLRLDDALGRQYLANGGPGYVSEVEGTGFLLAFVPDEPLPPGRREFTLTSEVNPAMPPITFELTVLGGEPIRNGTP